MWHLVKKQLLSNMSALLRKKKSLFNHVSPAQHRHRNTFQYVKESYCDVNTREYILQGAISKKKCELVNSIRCVDPEQRIFQGPLREIEYPQDINFLGHPHLPDEEGLIIMANQLQANTSAKPWELNSICICLIEIKVLHECARTLSHFREQIGMVVINPFEERFIQSIKNYFSNFAFLKGLLSKLEKYIIVNAYINNCRQQSHPKLGKSGERYTMLKLRRGQQDKSRDVEIRDMELLRGKGKGKGLKWGGIVCEKSFKEPYIDDATGFMWRSSRVAKTYRKGSKKDCVVICTSVNNRDKLICWRADGLKAPCAKCKENRWKISKLEKCACLYKTDIFKSTKIDLIAYGPFISVENRMTKSRRRKNKRIRIRIPPPPPPPPANSSPASRESQEAESRNE